MLSRFPKCSKKGRAVSTAFSGLPLTFIIFTIAVTTGQSGTLPVVFRPGSAGAQENAFTLLVASYRFGTPPGTGDLTMLKYPERTVRTIITTGNSFEVAVAPDGSYAIALNDNGTFSIITGLNSEIPIQSKVVTAPGASALAITPDGSAVAVVDGSSRPIMLRTWTGLPNDPRYDPRLDSTVSLMGTNSRGFTDAASDIALSSSGDTAIIPITNDDRLAVVDGILPGGRPASFRTLITLTPFPASPRSPTSAAFGPDDNYAYVANKNRIQWIGNLLPGRNPQLLGEGFSSLNWSNYQTVRGLSSNYVIAGREDGRVEFVPITGFSRQVSFYLGAGPTAGIAVSPGGSLAAVAMAREGFLAVVNSGFPLGETVTTFGFSTAPFAQQSMAFLPNR